MILSDKKINIVLTHGHISLIDIYAVLTFSINPFLKNNRC